MKKKDTNGFKLFRFICLAIVMPLAFIGVNLMFIKTAINKQSGKDVSMIGAVEEVKTSLGKADEYLGYIDLENKSVNIPKSTAVSKAVEQKDEEKEAEYNRLAHINRSVYLLSTLEKPENGNMIISEVSLIKALDMLSEGASNDTKEQLDNWVGKNEKNIKVADYQSNSVNMASLFLARSDENFPVTMKDSYKTLMLDNYNAKGRDFKRSEASQVADEENAWISDITGGLIKEGVTKQLLEQPDFVAGLYNIIYFAGEWREVLKVLDTPMDFTQADGTVLKARTLEDSDVVYRENKTLQAFIKSYYDEDSEYKTRYEFIGILPKEKGEVNLKNLNLYDLKAPDYDYTCNVTIPSFQFDYKSELVEPLQHSGLQFMFDKKKADFTAGFDIREEGHVYVSDVNQKARIEFNESGTKAASVTEIGMAFAADSVDFKPKEVKVINLDFNRPFAFMIWDTELDVPLFMGVVNTPDIATE